MQDPESDSYFFSQWRPPHFRAAMNSLLGPFSLFLLLQGFTKVTGQPWDNGSWGAAAVIMFSIPNTSASIPRHVIFGQMLSALVAFAFGYALPQESLNYLRVALSVGVASFFMKLFGISYPPGGATAYILSKEPLVTWRVSMMFFYLVFPLLVGTIILLVFGLFFNNILLRMKYPTIWI